MHVARKGLNATVIKKVYARARMNSNFHLDLTKDLCFFSILKAEEMPLLFVLLSINM